LGVGSKELRKIKPLARGEPTLRKRIVPQPKPRATVNIEHFLVNAFKEQLMRVRTILLIIAILALAGFTALNIDEFTRSSAISLGYTTIQVPLGLVMLALLVVAVVVFLASGIYMQSNYLLETRKHTRELSAQRELADKAEASRFTELRNYLDAQTAVTTTREAAQATVLSERLSTMQAALLLRIEQMDAATAAYMGQLESRFDQRNN
jgi:uncharacterized integral membrane protein